MKEYRVLAPNLPEAVRRELFAIAETFASLATGSLRVLNVAPLKPRDGDTAICDGTNWNPIGDGVKRPVWYDEAATTWKKFT